MKISFANWLINYRYSSEGVSLPFPFCLRLSLFAAIIISPRFSTLLGDLISGGSLPLDPILPYHEDYLDIVFLIITPKRKKYIKKEKGSKA